MVGTSADQALGSVRSFSPSHAWDAKVIEHPALPPRVVAVDKKEQVLTLLEFRSSLESTTYLCSTGQAPGDKIVEGDLKTPEGIYFVVQHLKSGLDFDMYGYEAYTLNYPNPVDKIRRKTGYGIWVHGKGNGIAPLQTQGCIALNNNDLHTLGNKLTPGMPIIISNSVDLHNPSGKKINNIKKLQELSQKWAKAWGDRSPAMFDFYDKEAYSIANEPFSAFKSNKERLFKRLPWIKTSIRDIQVLEGPGYWVTWFYQDYKAPNLTSKGVRRLYWSENRKGDFKIIGMEWLPGLNTSAQLAQEDPPVPPIDKAPKTETIPQKFDTITAEMEPRPASTSPSVASNTQRSTETNQPASKDTLTDKKVPGSHTKKTAPEKASPTKISTEEPSQQAADLLAQSSTGGVIGAAHSPTPLPVRKKIEQTAREEGTSEKRASSQRPQKSQGSPTPQVHQVPQAPQAPLLTEESQTGSFQKARTDDATLQQKQRAGQPSAKGQEVSGRQPSAERQAKSEAPPEIRTAEKADPPAALETLSDNEVLALIEGWRSAWEKGDLKGYLSYYAKNAIQDRRSGKAAIEYHKKALWKRAHPKTVALSQIDISRQGSTIVASMRQRYESRNGTGDRGQKTLYFKKTGASWQIVKETWSNN